MILQTSVVEIDDVKFEINEELVISLEVNVVGGTIYYLI